MDKRFNNGFTKLTVDGVVFTIGDYVASGRTKGIITGIDGVEFDILLDTGKIISYENVKHASRPADIPPPPVVQKTKIKADEKPPLQKTDKRTIIEQSVLKKSTKNNDFDKLAFDPPGYSASDSDCHATIARLERELEECNSSKKLPEIVENAPAEVYTKLPEVRTEALKNTIEESVEDLVKYAQSGDSAGVKKVEKVISTTVNELKEVAPQSTVSITDNCRVQISKVGGRDTIRIYFDSKPDKSTTTEIGKNGFRAYSETVNGRKEWYWGAFSNDKRLEFAKSFCKEETISTVGNEKKEYTPNSSNVKSSRYEILNENEAEFIRMYHKYNTQNDKYGITPRFSNHVLFAKGLLHEYENDAPKKLYPDFMEWAREWVREYPDWIPDKDLEEKPAKVIPPPTVQPKIQTSKSNKIILSSLLKEMMPKHQQAYLRSLDADGVQEMQPVIDNIERQISSITKRQDGKQAIVKAHYFYGGSDWYVTEYEGDSIIYGFAILNEDYENSEFGRSSIEEFNRVGRVEMDFYWTPRPLDEVLYKKDPDYFPKPSTDSLLRSRSSKLPDAPSPTAPEPSEKDKESSAVLSSIKSILERVAAAAAARANN